MQLLVSQAYNLSRNPLFLSISASYFGVAQALSLFFENDTERVIRKVYPYEAVPGEPTWHCGSCGVRINATWNSADEAYCPNHHLNRRPRI